MRHHTITSTQVYSPLVGLPLHTKSLAPSQHQEAEECQTGLTGLG